MAPLLIATVLSGVISSGGCDRTGKERPDTPISSEPLARAETPRAESTVLSWGSAETENSVEDLDVSPSGTVVLAGWRRGPLGPASTDRAKDRHTGYVRHVDRTGTTTWEASFAGFGSAPEHVRFGAGESVIIAGRFHTRIDLDPGPGMDERNTELSADQFIIKLDTAGKYLWGHTFDYGFLSEHFPLTLIDLLPTPDGGVIIYGRFQNPLDLDPGPGKAMRDPYYEGSPEAFFLKLDASGKYVWSGVMGGPGTAMPTTLVGASDDLIVAFGWFKDRVDLDPGPGTDERSVKEGSLGYAVAIRPDGTYVWGRTMDASARDAVVSGNALYIVGGFRDPYDFDWSAGVDRREVTDGTDGFVTRLGLDGTYGWTRTFSGGRDDNATAVAIAPDGSIVVAGTFADDLTFNGTGEPLRMHGELSKDIFLARLSPTGERISFESFGGDKAEGLAGIAIDSHGALVLAGRFSSPMDVPVGGKTMHLVPKGIEDVFLIRRVLTLEGAPRP